MTEAVLPLLVAAIAAVVVAGSGQAADWTDGFEDDPDPGGERCWRLAESDARPRLVSQGRPRNAPHGGNRCEHLVIEAESGTFLRIEYPLGAAAVIDELACSIWVRSNRPDVRLSARVTLPGYRSTHTGRPVETLVPGSRSRDLDRWESLAVDRIPTVLANQLPALRLEHGSAGDLTGAVATHLVLDIYGGPGRHEIAIDDLRVTGHIPPPSGGPPVRRDALVRPVAGTAEPPADPQAGLTRGVIEVAGLPFFPRSLQHNGEPLTVLAELGFNCVQVPHPATADLLDEARRAGLWVIGPPPPIPEVDVRDPDALPSLRNWDRVLMWDLGSGLSAADLEAVAERGRRVRACDPRAGRPLIATADSGLRDLSRHVDMLVARRTVLGTSLEFVDYVQWLRQRPLLARPGTPFLASLATEIDPQAAAQAAAIAGVGGRSPTIDDGSLLLAAQATVAAGARGILFTSSSRIDADDPVSRRRAAAVRATNLRLQLIEPWGAAGRFAAAATTSDPEVQAIVVEAARARVVLAWRGVQGSQVAARRYGGGDLPRDDGPLTLLVPGVPEAHQAWEIAPGGLRPLRQRRVTGGVSVTLDSFLSSAAVLFSGDPGITGHMQERTRSLTAAELASARALAATGLADAADLLGRLPPAAFSGPPPVAAAAMLSAANALAAEGEALAAGNPAAAVQRFHKAAAITGQFQRRIWENGVRADGSMVASPLASSASTAAEQWAFVAARTASTPGPERLAGGGMDRIDALAGSGWRHFAHPAAGVLTAVEISPEAPAAGDGCLRLSARAADSEAAPVAVETPPVWVTTPPIPLPAGTLVEITAQVRVPSPITASVDGLLVFDSLGGPALAERVGPTSDWRRLVLHRMTPADPSAEPLVVTFALSGIGAADIDEVSVRVLDRGVPGQLAATSVPDPTPPRTPSATAPSTERFPGPADLIAPRPPRPTSPALPLTSTWQDATVAWPRLPWTSPNAPPPGPGGGTIDPFKRARQTPD